MYTQQCERQAWSCLPDGIGQRRHDDRRVPRGQITSIIHHQSEAAALGQDEVGGACRAWRVVFTPTLELLDLAVPSSLPRVLPGPIAAESR